MNRLPKDIIAIPPGGGREVIVLGLHLRGKEAAQFVARPNGQYANGRGAGWPLKVALGAAELDPVGIEHFPVSDLAGIGLADYLTDGLGVELTSEARIKLSRVDDEIVILRPDAFAGVAQHLSPQPPLVTIGRYPLSRPATTMEMLRSTSAHGHIVPQDGKDTPTPKRMTGIMWAILAVLLLVIGAVIALVLTGAGG